MVNYYYEVCQIMLDTGVYANRYYSVCNVSNSDSMVGSAGGFKLTQSSDRIWQEQNGTVKFVKNRFADLYDTCGYNVDMEEFFMVKLQAQPYPRKKTPV